MLLWKQSVFLCLLSSRPWLIFIVFSSLSFVFIIFSGLGCAFLLVYPVYRVCKKFWILNLSFISFWTILSQLLPLPICPFLVSLLLGFNCILFFPSQINPYDSYPFTYNFHPFDSLCFILNSFFYPSSCCRFLALHNSLGTIIIEQILKYRYDFFSPIGKSCLKTELQFSDYYCLLAVHVLTDVWRETGKNQWFQFNFIFALCFYWLLILKLIT